MSDGENECVMVQIYGKGNPRVIVRGDGSRVLLHHELSDGTLISTSALSHEKARELGLALLKVAARARAGELRGRRKAG